MYEEAKFSLKVIFLENNKFQRAVLLLIWDMK